MSRVKPGYFIFLSSARISLGLGIVRVGVGRPSVWMWWSYQSLRLMLSFPNRRKNDGSESSGVPFRVSKALIDTRAYPRIRFSDGDVAALASRDLSSGLAAMLDRELASSADVSLNRPELVIDLDDTTESPHRASNSLDDDSFEVSRQGGGDGSIAIRAGSSRGLIHA